MNTLLFICTVYSKPGSEYFTNIYNHERNARVETVMMICQEVEARVRPQLKTVITIIIIIIIIIISFM